MTQLNPANEPIEQASYWSHIDDRIERYTIPPTGLPSGDDINLSGHTTSRSILEVATEHGYLLTDFFRLINHKRVLDIGGGNSFLQQEANSFGLDTQIVTVDAPKVYENYRCAQFEENRTVVAGIAQALPFRSASFDLAISTYALPWYVDASAHLDGFFNEALRVLKPGGKLSITPSYVIGNNDAESKNQLTAHLYKFFKQLNDSPDYNITFHEPYDQPTASRAPNITVIEKL